MNEPAAVTMKRKTSKVWKFFSWLFTPEPTPTLEQLLRDFPRFNCSECGKLMKRMEDSPCSSCTSRHIKELDARVAALRAKAI